MRTLYLITLFNIIFCINYDLLYSKKNEDLVNSILKEFINKTNSYPMPTNYESFISNIDFSGNFVLDILPTKNLTQEIENRGFLLSDDRDEMLKRLTIMKASRRDSFNKEDGRCFSSDSTCYYKIRSYIISKFDLAPEGRFAIFLYYNGITLAQKKYPVNTSKKVKVCTPSTMVFKICQEFPLEEAIKQTIKAYTFSQFKKELDSIYPKKK